MKNKFRFYRLNLAFYDFLQNKLKIFMKQFKLPKDEMSIFHQMMKKPPRPYIGLIYDPYDGQKVLIPMSSDKNHKSLRELAYVLPIQDVDKFYGSVLINKMLMVYNDNHFIIELDENEITMLSVGEEQKIINSVSYLNNVYKLYLKCKLTRSRYIVHGKYI